jgi:hypothetical protein
LVWLLFLAAIFGARAVWQRKPGFGTCLAFWLTSFVVLVLFQFEWTVSDFLLTAGILCNATVTLANGGFMPVAVRRPLDHRARSLWVQRRDGQRLLFLADNFGNDVVRFSIGDILLLAGIVAGAFTA